MKPPADGWDRDERDALDEIGPELDALQQRHAHDLHVDVLRAARHDALPGELQDVAAQHLAADGWSRALVDGLDDAGPVLDRQGEDRLLAHVRSGAGASRETAWWTWRRVAVAMAGAAVIVAAAWVVRSRPDGVPGEPLSAPPRQAATEPGPPAPPGYVIPLERPPVTLSLTALTWRGDKGENQLLADLKSPLDAFRGGDDARADRDLAGLESRYPKAVEVFFYGGVSRLFVDDPARAAESLTRAADIADDTFAPRVAWYRAIAEQRAGRTASALRLLEGVCRGGSQHAEQACGALRQLEGASKAPAR